MKRKIIHEGTVIAEVDITPVEEFIKDKLDEVFEEFMSGALTQEEAQKILAFLIILQPYLDQEAPALQGF